MLIVEHSISVGEGDYLQDYPANIYASINTDICNGQTEQKQTEWDSSLWVMHLIK